MIKRQAGRFILVGLIAVFIDTLVYFLLKSYFPPSYAKGVSFLTGTAVAYLLNKKWTFEESTHQSTKIIKFLALYLFTLSANVAVNSGFLELDPEAYIFSFLAATGTSTILNFIGQKWWVFKK